MYVDRTRDKNFVRVTLQEAGVSLWRLAKQALTSFLYRVLDSGKAGSKVLE